MGQWKQISNNLAQLHVDNDTMVLISYSTAVAVCHKGKSFRTEINHSSTTERQLSANGFKNAQKIPQSEIDNFRYGRYKS